MSNPSSTSSSFVLPIRIYYEDTDAAGIVYHANYIKFAERCRTEWLRSLGYDHGSILKEFGIYFVIKHLTIDYKAPALLDNYLSVHTHLETMGHTSLTIHQDIFRDETLIADLKVVIVTVNLEGQPQRIPPQLRQIFSPQTL